MRLSSSTWRRSGALRSGTARCRLRIPRLMADGRRGVSRASGPKPADQGRDSAHRKPHCRRPVGDRNPSAAGSGRGRAALEGPEVGPRLFLSAARKEALAPTFAVSVCSSSRAPRARTVSAAWGPSRVAASPSPRAALRYRRARVAKGTARRAPGPGRGLCADLRHRRRFGVVQLPSSPYLGLSA